MFKFIILLTLSFSVFALKVGDKAPAFSLKDMNGKEIKLSDYAGKTVVLEWLNHGCPFIRKHYDSNNMQTLQSLYTKRDVVWLSIISSAPGKQGHSTPAKAKADVAQNKAKPTTVLLDEDGTVGQAYSAKTTPHMYIIDKDGKLAYQGAIDSIPSADPSDVEKADNYVKLALNSYLDGKEIKIKQTKPYGCSVKY